MAIGDLRIYVENLLDEAGPRCLASLNKLRGGIGHHARACCRRGPPLTRGFRRSCAVSERSAAAIGDVGRDGVDPAEGIEPGARSNRFGGREVW
ncbi:MAG: hypothetical protein DMG09_00785 [Acidobacteria bacterium]|nr:MAG: hypothetical protein DMG09_00785 [Acidobacteriota bacterium]